MPSEVKSYRIIAEGEVQGVGYRRTVSRIALDFHVNGYVRNLSDGTVEIFAQGEEVDIRNFLAAIKVDAPPLSVKNIQVREISKPSKIHTHFQIKLGTVAQEIQEGLGSGQEQLINLNKQMSGFRVDFQDYRAEFGSFAQRTDQNFGTMDSKYGEISLKLTQILETFQKETAESRAELKKSVDNLSRLVDEFIESSRKSSERQNTL